MALRPVGYGQALSTSATPTTGMTAGNHDFTTIARAWRRLSACPVRGRAGSTPAHRRERRVGRCAILDVSKSPRFFCAARSARGTFVGPSPQALAAAVVQDAVPPGACSFACRERERNRSLRLDGSADDRAHQLAVRRARSDTSRTTRRGRLRLDIPVEPGRHSLAADRGIAPERLAERRRRRAESEPRRSVSARKSLRAVPGHAPPSGFCTRASSCAFLKYLVDLVLRMHDVTCRTARRADACLALDDADAVDVRCRLLIQPPSRSSVAPCGRSSSKRESKVPRAANGAQFCGRSELSIDSESGLRFDQVAGLRRSRWWPNRPPSREPKEASPSTTQRPRWLARRRCRHPIVTAAHKKSHPSAPFLTRSSSTLPCAATHSIGAHRPLHPGRVPRYRAVVRETRI